MIIRTFANAPQRTRGIKMPRMSGIATHPMVLTLLLLPAIWVAAKVILDPGFKPDRAASWATLLVLIAFVLGGRRIWKPAPRSIWFAVVAALLLIPAVTITRAFGRLDMIAVIFHAEFGVEGSTVKGLENQIAQAVLAVIYLLVPTSCIAAVWGMGSKLYVALALALLTANPALRFAVTHYAVPAPDSDLVEWLVPAGQLTDHDNPPDLVIIYLEGTDRRYAEEAIWGPVYRPLAALASEGTSFTGVTQIEGTGWSLAGMVASQCGVPVVPRGLIYNNEYDKLDGDFMPNVTCLGDILAAQGYSGAYVVGGDERFAGIDRFYAAHGGPMVYGPELQRKHYPADEIAAAQIDWVLDDQMTFDTARWALSDLTKDNVPYFLIVETIGPHGPTGYLSRKCSDTGRGVVTHNFREVVACTIGDTVAFVADLRERHAIARPDRPLGIVILSDHLSHYNGEGTGGPGYANSNTAIFLGLSAAPGRVVEKTGAMIDIFPTILNWAGFTDRPGANLGRSLLSDVPTITEDHGPDLLSHMLITDAKFSNTIWD